MQKTFIYETHANERTLLNQNFANQDDRMFYQSLTTLTSQYTSSARKDALKQAQLRAISIIIAMRRAVVG